MAALPHFSSFTWPWLRQIWHCTPQCEINRSRTAPASPLREFFPLWKFWVFPQRACMLSAMPEMGTNVSAHPQRQKKGYTLCLVIIVLSMPYNTTKQQGNALGLQIHIQDGTNCPTCFVPALTHIWSPNPSSFHCRDQPIPRLPKCCSYTWAVASSGFEYRCDCFWNVAVNIVNLNKQLWWPFLLTSVLSTAFPPLFSILNQIQFYLWFYFPVAKCLFIQSLFFISFH